MIHHTDIAAASLRILIRTQQICYGGNKKLKIYGTLHCKSGKRMNKENRVFFSTKEEALENNFRPCGHCLRKEYNEWKINSNYI
ncbi:Ada metal-binding domain-containing protein [Aquimarina sp. 2201CG1-2-11]|uniref:Ada metal-binding domain-containing protein n=1 Tax=Aquimarina discodermiae TaxID=3231043 RepID=UPI003463232B